MPTGFADIINRLEKQKVAIDRAIAALKDVGDEEIVEPTSTPVRRGRKAGTKVSTTNTTRMTRTMSPEARERISAAQRKRWAKTKRAAKKAQKSL